MEQDSETTLLKQHLAVLPTRSFHLRGDGNLKLAVENAEGDRDRH